MSANVSACLCGLALIASSYPALAQQPKKTPRIGYLAGPLSAMTARTEAFRQGLRELGYVEGTNIFIEWRDSQGKRDRQLAFAAELVRLNVDVIIAVGGGDLRAAKQATATIPIVMTSAGDPVASGFVASLSRPGGNVTGWRRFARR